MTLDAFAGDDAEIQPPAGKSGAAGLLFRLVRDQRVAFHIIGGMTAAIGAAWFISFLCLFPRGAAGYPSALACAHIAAVLCAFVLVNLSTLGFNFATPPVLVAHRGISFRPGLAEPGLAGQPQALS